VADAPVDLALEIENSVIRLLAQREHSRAELEHQLS